MSTWTDERKAKAIKLYREGHSASQVAKQIGGVTRNAVIGMISRAGVSRSVEAGRIAARVNAGRPLKAPTVQRSVRQGNGLNFKNRTLSAPAVKKAGPNPLGRKAAAPIKVAADGSRTYQMKPDLALPPEPPPPAVVVPLEALHSHSCRWPIGDPSSPHFGFCGLLTGLKPVGGAETYCQTHKARAFVSPKPHEPKDGKALERQLRRFA